MLPRTALVICGVFVVAASSATAAPVVPGGFLNLSEPTFTPPAGDVVAEDTRHFTLAYAVPSPDLAFGEGEGAYDATLTSRVFRGASGILTFFYEFVANKA